MRTHHYTFSKIAAGLIISSLISFALIVIATFIEYNIGLNKIIYNAIRILGSLIIALTIIYGFVNLIEALSKKLNIRKVIKKTELNHIKAKTHRYRIHPMISGLMLFIGIIAFSFIGSEIYKGSNESKATIPTPLSQIDISTPPVTSPVISPSPKSISNNYKNNDPIESCTGQNSKQTVYVKRSECQNKYTDCEISNVWKLLTKEDCTKQQANQNKSYSNSYSYTPPIPSSGQLTIDCSYSGGEGYNFNFGQLTYEECTKKSNEYFAQKRAEIDAKYPASSVTPTTPVVYDYSQSCRQYLNDAIRIAQIRFGDSSAYEAAVSIYQNSIYPRCLSTGIWQE